MKKATIITIVAALLLIVSCNVDSEHGIYYQVATSQPTSGISIIQSLGCIVEGEDVTHIFLSDDGLYSTPSTKGGTELVPGSQGKNIRGAYFDINFPVFIYSDATGTVYTLLGGESTELGNYADYKFEISSNGFAYNKDHYASVPYGVKDAAISNPRFNGQMMLSMDGTTKAKIYTYNSDEEPLSITGLTANATGFTVAKGASSYFVFNDKSVYEVTDTQTELNDETLVVSGLEAAPTGGYKAVQYSDDTNTPYLLVRTSKGFTKINTDEDEVVEKNVQFLSALNDVVVLDMYTIGNSSKIAIVTYANGIRIADMENKTVTDDIL